MPRCPHNRVQQYTECCMDCGRNVYETDEQYLAWLRAEKVRRVDKTAIEIDKLERELGIEHPGNRSQKEHDPGPFGPDPFGYDI